MRSCFLQTAGAVSILLSACLGGVAHAEEPTFAKLQSMCSDANDTVNYGFCIGFVEAIALRVLNENKNCTLLREYIDKSDANLAFPDLIADLDPKEYPGNAFQAVERYFFSKGC